MEIDCKATEIEQLQSKLNETASLSSADNDPEDNQVRIRFIHHQKQKLLKFYLITSYKKPPNIFLNFFSISIFFTITIFGPSSSCSSK